MEWEAGLSLDDKWVKLHRNVSPRCPPSYSSPYNPHSLLKQGRGDSSSWWMQRRLAGNYRHADGQLDGMVWHVLWLVKKVLACLKRDMGQEPDLTCPAADIGCSRNASVTTVKVDLGMNTLPTRYRTALGARGLLVCNFSSG